MGGFLEAAQTFHYILIIQVIFYTKVAYMKSAIRKVYFYIFIICTFITLYVICEFKNVEEPKEEVLIEYETIEYETAESKLNYETSVEVDEVEVEEEVAVEIIPDEQEEIVEEQKLISLGKFKLTAYCSCKKCCGKWAINRPKDENGNEIVYGSVGIRLIEGISVAVDPRVIPYKTDVVINGDTYIAHDTGGAIKGNRIDVYFDDHQEARNFGVQYAEVFIAAP